MPLLSRVDEPRRRFPDNLRQASGRADAGWYQIRCTLKAYGSTELTDFAPFDAANAAMSATFRPHVYEDGFLPA